MLSKRAIAAMFAATLLAIIGTGITTTPASAQSGLIYQAVDSDSDEFNGIYLRNGTSMDFVDRVSDRYVPYGTDIELHCGTWGDPVGPHQNQRWHLVEVLDGPAAYELGWIADRYTNTPNVANQPTPGEPECEEGGAVFFEPEWEDGNPQAGGGEALIIDKEAWSDGTCSIERVDNSVPRNMMLNGKRITSMGVWSIGRMAPTYMVEENWEMMRQFNFLVMYDPGEYAEFASSDSCDQYYDHSSALLQWLNEDSNNVLLVLAGEITYDGGNYEGIQQFLFDDITGKPAADQVYVCGYTDMGHNDVVWNFGHVLAGGRTTSCPGNPDDEWQP